MINHSVLWQVEIIRRDYWANGGWETFLSYEDPEQDILVGLLRLRLCSADTYRPELKPHTILGTCSIVRELHVYGSVVPVASRDPGKFQHQGFGQLLMEEAARIALEEHGSYKLAVISGVGTRDYYRKLGYELEGPYMVKALRDAPRTLTVKPGNVVMVPDASQVRHVTLERSLDVALSVYRGFWRPISWSMAR